MSCLRIILCLHFLLFHFAGIAQSVIKGIIADSSNKLPVANCTVYLINIADSSIESYKACDEKGAFSFDSVAAGRYFIKAVSAFNSEVISSVFSLSAANVFNLPPLALMDITHRLQGVTVNGYRPALELKKGVIILHVERNMISSGSTALELLKLVPGVSVDNQEQVFINGKNGVGFLIDGRLQQLPASQVVALLNGMSAETVSTIELMKNPSARYDASGTAGLINIVTRKANTKGWNGNISESISLGKKFRSISVLSLNYKSDKLSLFSSLSYMDLQYKDTYTFNRIITGNNGLGNYDQSGVNENRKSITNLNAGVEYVFSSKTSAAITVTGGPAALSPATVAATDISGPQTLNYTYLKYTTTAKETYNNPSANLDIRHQFDSSGTQLQYNAGYTILENDQSKISQNSFYDAYRSAVLSPNDIRNRIDRRFTIFTQKLDFARDFKRAFALESGVKYALVNNRNTTHLAITGNSMAISFGDTSVYYRYDYKEQVLAGYTTLSKTIGKTGIQAGLRLEHTNVAAQNTPVHYDLRRSYTSLFPSASVNFNPDQANSIQLSYSKRIARPDYDRLNPIRIVNEQLGYVAGNPALLPEYSHNLNIDYSYKGFITAGFGYIRSSNSPYYYNYSDVSSRVSIDTVVNFQKKEFYTGSLFFDKQIYQWYKVQVNAMAALGNFRGIINQADASSRSYKFNISATNDFYLPHNVRLQVSGYYSSPFSDGIQRYYHTTSFNLVIQKSFYNKSLFVSAGITDLFYSQVVAYSSNLPGQSFYYRQKEDTRRVKLSVNYQFGKTKMNKRANRNEEEESKRLKKIN